LTRTITSSPTRPARRGRLCRENLAHPATTFLPASPNTVKQKGIVDLGAEIVEVGGNDLAHACQTALDYEAGPCVYFYSDAIDADFPAGAAATEMLVALMASAPSASRQDFCERLPIVPFPSCRQMFRLPLRETGMVEDDLGTRALFDEFKSRNRVKARTPIYDAPGLNDSFVWHECDMSSHNMSSEDGERTSDLRADIGRRGSERHSRPHRGTEVDYLIELGTVR
jgi:hypothetical protein